MRQKIIKRILALSMVGVMVFSLVACSNNQDMSKPNDIEDTPTINVPSESQPTQEVETTPTPTPSEEPTPGQEPTPSEATPTQEPTPTPSETTTTNEPTTTQEPTQSQEPIQTQAPTTTTTPTPTTPPTSTPIHTHSFKGGDCSTPSICECGEIGSYGDHNWSNRHIDEVGHYESSGTHRVMFKRCDCGFEVNSDTPNVNEVWTAHTIACRKTFIYWYEDAPNGEEQYVIDIQAHDEVYCVICGSIQ